MNIYFSCSVTGGRSDQTIYHLMVENLLSGGHTVPTAHLAGTDVLQREEISDAGVVYHRDVDWVTRCEALIAEVSTPSHGVGYEIALALQLGKPVLCVFQAGRKISKMILGNDLPNIRVAAYRTPEEALGLMSDFIASL